MAPQDALWLEMDRPTGWMVVDVVVVLDDVVPVAVVRQAFERLVARHPVFACRARRRLGGWWWEQAEDFDLDRHVRSTDLGPDATIADVQDVVGAQRSVRLDPAHPLWTAAVLAPVAVDAETTGTAVAMRVHHAIADGVRLTQALLGVLSPLDEATAPTVVQHRAAGPDAASVATAVLDAGRVGVELARGAVRGAVSVVRRPGSSVRDAPATAAAAWRGFSHPDRLADRLLGGQPGGRVVNDVTALTKLAVARSTPTVWTGEPGRGKSVAWSAPIELAGLRAAARRHGATVNDVLVAAFAGGLRAYLLDRDALVDDVVWMVPVNLDPFDAELPAALGNHFALVLVDLPLRGATPLERLADVRRRMLRIKDSDEPITTFALQRLLSLAPRPLGGRLTGFFADRCVGVLSDVPGPRAALALGGARVRQIVGFAPSSGRQPMSATIFTYAGTVTVGIAADAGLVADPDALVDATVREFAALAEA